MGKRRGVKKEGGNRKAIRLNIGAVKVGKSRGKGKAIGC